MRNSRSLRLIILPAMLLCAAAGCNRGDGPAAGVTASVSGGAGGANGDNPDSSASANLQNMRHPVVRMDTSLGAITLELDADQAPITVKNFLWYTDNGYYDQTILHQVLRDYVALGGGYSTELSEKPTHIAIRNEACERLKNLRGTIAMARRPDVIDSSTSQFFLNLADNRNLDQRSRNNADEFGYCVFGKVVSGSEVLDKISAVTVADTQKFPSAPVQPVVIRSVSRVR